MERCVFADRSDSRPILFEYLEAVLGSAQSYSVLFIERAVVGLLRLCLIVSESVSVALPVAAVMKRD